MKRLALSLTTLLSIVHSLGTLAAEESREQSPRRPNVIVVFIDDMGWGDFSCFGNRDAKTPNVDRLAAEGIRFEQFYVNAPICSPSRCAITTGQYPQRWRITSYLNNRADNARRGVANWLDPTAPTLARMLRERGYATGHFGKWHLGGQRDVDDAPPISAYGFDESLTNFEGMGAKLLPLTLKPGQTEPGRIWADAERLGKPVTWMPRSRITTGFVEAAIPFMERATRERNPFYINLWPDDVHSPFWPPVETWADNKRGLYLSVLQEMDRQLGKLFDYVRDSAALRDNTLIVVCSDNGPEPGAGSAGPFRGAKTRLYEGGIRSPLIVWGPGLIAPEKRGTRNESSVFAAFDLVPSLLALSGAKTSTEETLDGEDVSATLVGRSTASRKAPIYWRRPPDRKNAPPAFPEPQPDLAVRDGDWKLLCNYDGSQPELYDLAKDRAETTNVAEQHSEIVKRLAAAVVAWHQSVPADNGPALGVVHQKETTAVATQTNEPASRPDIVVFLTDDHSQLDSSPYGNRAIRTPNMQRLADAGMTFTRAFVASPSCAPSRAALLTGLMPARNGAESNHAKPRANLKKWPAYFQELGYEVAAFGKVSHYKHTADYGFDRFAHDGFHDHAAIGAAVEFLKNRSRENAKPLCLMVGSNWPHVPWPEANLGYDPEQLPLPAGSIDTPATRQWRARYAAAVTKADDDLGQILDAARSQLGSETMFVFTADHGAQWPFGKWNLYESGICVPLIVAWPGRVQAGSRSDAMVQWIDLLPTFVDAASGDASQNRKPTLDGRSFLPVLLGTAKTHRDRIFTTHANDNRMNVYPSRAVRTDRWKYLRNLHPEYAFTTHIDLVAGRLGQRAFFSTWEAAAKTDPTAAAILKRYHARPAEELYDLNADPHEQHNLAADQQYAATLSMLRAELDEWMKSQGDQQKTLAEPRLLSVPTSYGPAAEILK